jgi:hypothetical protein
VIVTGILLLAAALTYFAVPAQSLPSFMGWISGSDVIRWKRDLVCLILALTCLFVGFGQARRGRSTAS